MKIGQFNIQRIPRMPLCLADEVMLTDAGKLSNENNRFKDTRGKVLNHLDNGQATLKDIAAYTGLPADKVKDAVIDLIRRGLVRRTTIEGTTDYTGFKSL